MALLKTCLHEMVKMSPLQGYTLEIVQDNPEVRVLGAAVTAEQAVTYASTARPEPSYK